MRAVLAAICAIGFALLPVGGPALAGKIEIRPVEQVVELFTSQGCSSCPPAERILTDLASEPGVLALAYHVDYWDYIGWRDIFGSAENTERQRAYASAFGTTTIYTPQVVVNGMADAIGSHEGKVRALMDKHPLSSVGKGASVTMRVEEDRLHITADAALAGAGGKHPVLMLVTYDDETRTAIGSGENRGTTIVNTHAVQDWRILGMWAGQPLEIDLPLDMLTRPQGEDRGWAALLQSVTDKGEPGPILAAAQVEYHER
ncbi:DUF1223 domain-containing protein [Aurantimonas sp. A2-1-M11]|uniref:DUF1223 domain-containing protein n=1 Tax=Aurantimonas sp. A2-1-M11 TaxID=3113712 RepID=UPI002F930505